MTFGHRVLFENGTEDEI